MNWNIDRSDKPSPQKRRNDALLKKMLASPSLKPTMTISKLLALIIALIPLAMTVFIIGLAIYIPVVIINAILGKYTGLAFVLCFAEILALLAVWLFLPAVEKWPKDRILPRSEFTYLYGIADEVAKALDVRPIDGIVISKDFNASYSRSGWLRNKSLLTIGFSLWSLLDDQEKIVLLGHELGHQANGDFVRGFLIGTACESLYRWTLITTRIGYLLPIGLLTFLLLYILMRLLFHESRRAEYYADTQSALIGGKDAALSLLEKGQFSDDFATYIRHVRLARIAPETLFERFKDHVAKVLSNPVEREKIERHVSTQADAYAWTHPPFEHRRAFLESRPSLLPQITLTSDEAECLRKELEPLDLAVRRILLGLA